MLAAHTHADHSMHQMQTQHTYCYKLKNGLGSGTKAAPTPIRARKPVQCASTGAAEEAKQSLSEQV